MNDERARRVGINEAIFRQVNERLSELRERFDLSGDLDLVCECSRIDCSERLSIPAAKYEQVRADPHRFLIVPDHEDPELERVVERTERYVVVEKETPNAREVAEKTDPRS